MGPTRSPQPFVGAYQHAVWGKITVRIDGDGAVLDAGEWKAGLGRKREADGTEKLVVITTPWLDWPVFARRDVGGRTALVIEDTARPVVFVRSGR